MDSSGATAPLIVLGMAGFGLLLVALAAVVLLRPERRPAAAAPGSSRPEAVDDLATFHAHPPGSPGAPAPATSVAVAPLAAGAGSLAPIASVPPRPPAGATDVDPPDDGLQLRRFLLALAALALVLIAAAAAVAVAAPASGAARAASRPSSSTARLSFASVVLEQQAVGVTMTRPTAALTTAGHRALLHLRLPTWNCLAPNLPDDPAAAGCAPSVTEYGDLPTPALSFRSDGTTVRLQGRVPTYTRHNGSGPTSTGRVYDVTMTVTPGKRLGPGRYVAEATLTLGSATAHTDGDALQNLLTLGR